MEKSKAELALKIILLVAFTGFTAVLADVFRERGVKVGDKAPAFSISTDEGRTMTVSDFGGKLLVLNFWATWCPPCIEEFPSLDQFQREMKDAGVVVLAVSIDKNERMYKRFLAQARPAFPTALDSEADIASSYGTFKWPETYVIGRDGRVLQKLVGAKNWMDPALIGEIRRFL